MAGISRFEEIESWKSATQFINFLGMVRASAGEVRSQLYIASDQKYILQEQFDNSFQLAQICSRQITNFIKYLEANPRSRRISDDSAEYNL